MREIRILKELKHDNIVNLIEVFRWKGKIFLVFEFVPHTMLEELENNPSGLSLMEIKKYMWQLIRGTDFVHQHNVIHRDLKPENLLISKFGALKICDFGFARFLSGPDSLYTDYVSTRWYRAPELLVGDANYGQAIDVWAVGCLLAELVTGQPLFPGVTDLQTLQLILEITGGELTEKQRKVLDNNPIFSGVDTIKICNNPNRSSIDARFGKLDTTVIDFLKLCLAIDPAKRPSCKQLLEHSFFGSAVEGFAQEMKEINRKDAEDFQMRTKIMQQSSSSKESSTSNLHAFQEFSHIAKEDNEANKGIFTFNKQKNELNSSFSKKDSAKGAGGANTLKELNNPLKQVNSKRNFKEADFQNPPSFLKSEINGSKNGEAEGKYGLPHVKGKNNKSVVSNAPKVNRLIALPHITEAKNSSEKTYLKEEVKVKRDSSLEDIFEYKQDQNESGEEENTPSMLAPPTITNKKANKKDSTKQSMFPSIMTNKSHPSHQVSINNN